MTDRAASASPVSGASVFITGLGIAQICSWGSLYYSFPQIAEQMGPELGWSKPELYGAATLGLVLSGLLSYPVGAAIDRGHGRRIMAGASFAAGLALLAWSQVTMLPLFYILAATVGALQSATLYDPAFAVIARRTGPARARDAITALTLWGGFASTVFIPLVELLIQHLSWRGCLMVLGGINLTVCAGLYALVIDPRADVDPTPHAEGPLPKQGRAAVAEAMRNPVFWALALTFTAYTAAFSMFIFHFYPLLSERGFTSSDIILALGVIGPAQVAGRIALWTFAPRAHARVIGSLVVIAFPIAFFVIQQMQAELIPLLAASILYGAANGIMTIVRGISVPEMLSKSAYGAINGALSVPMILAKAFGPLAGAMLWSASGNYAWTMWVVFALAVVLALSFWAAAYLSHRNDGRVLRTGLS